MPQVLIADDHPLFREALRSLVIRALGSATEVLEADSVEALYALVSEHGDADLLLLDLHMPGAQGLEPLLKLRAQWPQLPVVIVSAHGEAASVQLAKSHGASGFIPKSTDVQTLGAALQAILEGDTWFPDAGWAAQEHGPASAVLERLAELTPQQLKVLQMAAAGLLNKQIAHELGTSEATVKAHMSGILRKLGASNRTQAVSIFNRLEMAPPSGFGGL